MLEHLMVAVDLTPTGETLLPRLAGLRRLGARRVTLVHVAEVDYPMAGAVAHLDHHRARLGEMAAGLRQEGFEVESQARHGNPVTELLRAAAEVGAHLVLVGSRSRSRIAEAFLGSVATEVVERSTLPVLVERLGVEAGAPPSRILLPTDLSDPSLRAVHLVEGLPDRARWSVTLLHVLDGDGRRDTDTAGEAHAQAEAEAALEPLAEGLRSAGFEEVGAEVATGDPARIILEAAARVPGTLLIMGTRGRGFLGRPGLGKVIRRVLRETAVPALLVPAKEEE
ncbi:MAG: universal stress protein [Gemmatimonadales bacterium]|nr:MAG: universal stress protein [Gemmatimonadales bacterium]